MKKFLLLFIITVQIAFGQSLSAPNPGDLPIGLSNQAIPGFSLSGFNSSTVLKASLAIVDNPGGVTFNINSTTGLTRDYGYNSWTNITSINFSGTQENINKGLASLKLNTSSVVDGQIDISFAVTTQQINTYYNPTNGHVYKSVASSVDYVTAKSLAAQSTYEGVQGYLVTITSQDEQNFIVEKTSQNNIWIALEDIEIEGHWKISAGPEAGTLIKTSNGQLTGNISGQYNNWCGGEPNNSGNEDAAVTKWGGGGCWNDLPASGYFGGGYVIEYGDWTDPSQSTFSSTLNAMVTFTQTDGLYLKYNFNFGASIDETQFSVKMVPYINPQEVNTNLNSYQNIGNGGAVILTSQVDTVMVPTNNFKALTTGGQVEWAIIYGYNPNLNGHIFLIDERKFHNTGIDPSTISKIQLFDIYNGPVSIYNISEGWKQYILPGNLSTQINNSSYSSYLRYQEGWYGTMAEFTFENLSDYKNQAVLFQSLSSNDVIDMVNNIITVSDVYLAFKELSNTGLNSNETGNEFTHGLQYMNSDVNGDGIFNFQDTYKLLQHLNGTSNLLDYNTLAHFMKISSVTEYNSITKSNWVNKANNTGMMYDYTVDKNNLISIVDLNITWKGDIDLSHSPIPTNNQTSKFIKTSYRIN
jgi:hypothetical protein